MHTFKRTYVVGLGILLILIALVLPVSTTLAVTATSTSGGNSTSYQNNNAELTYNGQTFYECKTTTLADFCSFSFSGNDTSYGAPNLTSSNVANTSASGATPSSGSFTYYFNQSMINAMCPGTAANISGFPATCTTGTISNLSCNSFWNIFKNTNSAFIVSGASSIVNSSGLINNTFDPNSAMYFTASKPFSFNDLTSSPPIQGTTCLGPNPITSSRSIGQPQGSVISVAAGSYVVPSTTTTGSTGNSNNNTKADCTASGIDLSWIICPVIDGISNIISGFYNSVLAPMLNVDSSQFIGSSSFFYQAWSNFRIIADILLVLIMLLVVFGETIGGGLLDAYTIKKAIPRLVVMVILSNLSVYIVVALIDVFNILGKGIEALLVAPFPNLNISTKDFSGVTSLTLLFGGIWAGAAAFGGIAFFLLFLLIPGILALVATFITLGLRQIIIMFLLIASPIAFILYIMPNTEKYFKKWWGLLIKTLMVYPIVFAIYALSQIAIVGLFKINTSSGTLNVIDSLLAIFAMLLPIFLIPFAFKMSGGLVGGAYGLLNKAMKGEPYKRFIAGQRKKSFGKQFGKMQSNNRYNTDTRFDKLNTANRFRNSLLQNATLLPEALQGKKSPSAIKNNLAAARGLRNNQIGMEALKNQSPALQSIGGDPDAVNAGVAHGTNEDLIATFLADIVGKRKGSALTDQELRDIKLKARNVAQAVRGIGHGAFKEIAPTLKAQSSGAYSKSPTSNGIATMLSEVIAASDGNIELARQGAIRATKTAGEAGRSDLALSAGDTLTALDEVQKVYDTYGTFNSVEAVARLSEINNKYYERIIQTKGASALVGAKSSAIDNIAPTMVKGLDSYTTSGPNSDDFFKRLAAIANTYDTLSSISPESAAKFSDQVLSSRDFGDGSATVIELLEKHRTDPRFLNFRREGMMQSPGTQTPGSPPTTPTV